MTRAQEGTVLFVTLLLVLGHLTGVFLLSIALDEYQTAEQRSLQIHMPEAPPEKDTIAWTGP